MTARLLRFALLADGRSDRALLPILTWLVRQQDLSVELPEPGFRARVANQSLALEIAETISLFGPDVLFVHRDAEAVDPLARRAEIPDGENRVVKVVPVRMTEAWLLFDEAAIRKAAGNPSGRRALHLPSSARVESVADPKTRLREALLEAAEVSGRQRKRFQQEMSSRVQRVAELITDYSPLRPLSAFARLEADYLAFTSRS